MEKVIIEVGSTNTKIDIYDGNIVKRLEEITIPFKQHYKENKSILDEDVEILINKINELKNNYTDIFVCGTSIFRDLNDNERIEVLTDFKNRTGLEFRIISSLEENKFTVLGTTRFVKDKVGVFVGGGGSTEISIYDKEIIDSKNTPIGVMDVMNVFPDLDNDLASTTLEEVMEYIEKRLDIPSEKADILILAGGGHEFFARNSGIK